MTECTAWRKKQKQKAPSPLCDKGPSVLSTQSPQGYQWHLLTWIPPLKWPPLAWQHWTGERMTGCWHDGTGQVGEWQAPGMTALDRWENDRLMAWWHWTGERMTGSWHDGTGQVGGACQRSVHISIFRKRLYLLSPAVSRTLQPYRCTVFSLHSHTAYIQVLNTVLWVQSHSIHTSVIQCSVCTVTQHNVYMYIQVLSCVLCVQSHSINTSII